MGRKITYPETVVGIDITAAEMYLNQLLRGRNTKVDLDLLNRIERRSAHA